MLILFDLDDTLLDHDTAARAAAARLHEQCGSTAPLDQFLAAWQAALDRHYGRWLAGEISLEGQRRARIRECVEFALSDAAADAFFAHYLADYELGWSLFPDVLPCLDRLAGYALGVVTNGHTVQQRKKLARLGVADRFEYLVTSDEHGCAKPDPKIFDIACRAAGVSAGSAVYVGDRYDVDAQAARAAGLVGVWLDRRGVATSAHVPPIIDALDRLPDTLREISRGVEDVRRSPSGGVPQGVA